jgi:SAM-dependent methyltransferase
MIDAALGWSMALQPDMCGRCTAAGRDDAGGATVRAELFDMSVEGVKRCGIHNFDAVVQQAMLDRHMSEEEASEAVEYSNLLSSGVEIRVAGKKLKRCARGDKDSDSYYARRGIFAPCYRAHAKRVYGANLWKMELGQVRGWPKTVVIVGNGPSASAGGLGWAIDRFDDVIRFNDHRIKDHEQHVGTKTTTWSTAVGGVRKPGRPKCNVVVIACWTDLLPHQADYKKKLDRFGTPNARVPADLHLQCWAELKAIDRRATKPSSGVMLAAMMMAMGHKDIAIHGFDHFDRRSQHHYWVKSQRGEGRHNGQPERVWFQRHIDAGHLIPLVDHPLAQDAPYREVYDEVYRRGYEQHADPDYTNARPLIEFVTSRIGTPSSVLDVGASKGAAVARWSDLGAVAKGIEISELAAQEARRLGRVVDVGNAIMLPYAASEFEMTTSSDVLEHLTEIDARRAIAEMARVSRRWVANKIACRPARMLKHFEGTALPQPHLTIRPIEWWKQVMIDCGLEIVDSHGEMILARKAVK